MYQLNTPFEYLVTNKGDPVMREINNYISCGVPCTKVPELGFFESTYRSSSWSEAYSGWSAARSASTAAANRPAKSYPQYNSQMRTTCVATKITGKGSEANLNLLALGKCFQGGFLKDAVCVGQYLLKYSSDLTCGLILTKLTRTISFFGNTI